MHKYNDWWLIAVGLDGPARNSHDPEGEADQFRNGVFRALPGLPGDERNRV
jgi:hypothetical protein